MTRTISTSDPAPAPEKPQAAPGGLTSAAPGPATLGALQADLAAGRITMPDFLTRLVEMSGGAAQGALSNPSVGLANSAFDAARGITGTLIRGEQFSQRDARAVGSLAPFSNFLPVVWATNAMIGGLPNRDTHRHPN